MNAIDADASGEEIPADTMNQVAFAPARIADIDGPSVRLEFRLDGPCWISAMADDERVLYRLMHEDERGLIQARSVIVLRIGDAGSFSYWINGLKGRPLGDKGEVVSVRIEPSTLGQWTASMVDEST